MDVQRALAATEDVVTPVAVVDAAALERNLERMQQLAERARVALRPHAKTHKSSWIARRQLAHGAVGLTVATLLEAEVFADAGAEDLLLAHPPAGAPKLRRLAALSERAPRLAVALDSVELAKQLPPRVDVLWEVDTGLGRLGTKPGRETVRAVEDLVRVVGAERFRGLVTHAGHVYGSNTTSDRSRIAAEEAAGLVSTAEELPRLGIEARVLSVGSTPTAVDIDAGFGVTEMRPGTYVFGDANQVALEAHALEDCAFAVVATVVSLHLDRAVADAGTKALSNDLRVPRLETFGRELGHEGVRLERLNEEHCILTGDGISALKVGARIVLLPAHVCTAVNLHADVLVLDVSGGTRWEPIDARGWGARMSS